MNSRFLQRMHGFTPKSTEIGRVSFRRESADPNRKNVNRIVNWNRHLFKRGILRRGTGLFVFSSTRASFLVNKEEFREIPLQAFFFDCFWGSLEASRSVAKRREASRSVAKRRFFFKRVFSKNPFEEKVPEFSIRIETVRDFLSRKRRLEEGFLGRLSLKRRKSTPSLGFLEATVSFSL